MPSWARRGELFAAASTDSFLEYNRARIKTGQAPEPALIVFIDRFKQFWDLFSADDAYNARIQQLIQEGSGRGIHFVVTAMAKTRGSHPVPLLFRRRSAAAEGKERLYRLHWQARAL